MNEPCGRHSESDEQELERKLQLFFASELPEELPPLPRHIVSPFCAAPQARTTPARILACAAVLMVAVGLGWKIYSDRQQPSGPPIAERAVTGPGFRIAKHALNDVAGAASSWPSTEGVVEFRWLQLEVNEPYSGEQVDLVLPQMTLTLARETITTFPVLTFSEKR